MIRLIVALFSLVAFAWPTVAGASQPASAAEEGQPAYTLDQLIARRLVQHAARFVRPGNEQDSQAGYRAAVGILEWAAQLAPDDVEIHRRLAAAGAVLDPALPVIVQAERNLLRLEPDNAGAQFSVINRAIDSRQSVTERLALCERLLRSTAGSRLAPEVLSHVAYRAGALAQEQGRASIAASYLEEALKRNPTNLDAAALNALEVDRQTAKVELLVRAMVQLVKADPTNEAALGDLVAIVQESGFHSGAADLIEAMSSLVSRRKSSIPDDLLADYAFLRCADTGPRTALDLINQRQESFDRFERQRRQYEWMRQQQAEQEKAKAELRIIPPLGEIPTFDDVTVELSVQLQLARVLLAMAAEAHDELESGLASLERHWAARLDELQKIDRSTLPESAVSALQADERRIIADRTWTRLWVNLRVEEAAVDLAGLEASGEHDPAELQRLRSWLRLRSGDPQGAIDGLQSLQVVDPLSDLGVALAQVELGRSADAARLLGEIYQSQPGRLVGMLCKWEYENLTGKIMPEPRSARAVKKELDRFPEVLRDLLTRPQRYFSLSITPRVDRVNPLDPITFDLVVHNDGPWPVAIGPGKILPSRVAVFSIFHLSGKRLPTGTPPLTLELQRRLMLRPGQEIVVPIAIDHTLFGLLVPSLAVRPLSVEFQAMLDYEVGPEGGYRPRPWSLVRQSRPMQITSWPEAIAATAPDLAAGISPQDPAATAITIAKISSLFNGRTTGILEPAANAELLAAADAGMNRLMEVWPELDAKLAAWAVLTLPFQTEATVNRIAVLDQFEAAARRSTEPLVQMAWITARTGTDTDVVLEGALRSDHPQLRAIAQDVFAYLHEPPASEPEPALEDVPEK